MTFVTVEKWTGNTEVESCRRRKVYHIISFYIFEEFITMCHTFILTQVMTWVPDKKALCIRVPWACIICKNGHVSSRANNDNKYISKTKHRYCGNTVWNTWSMIVLYMEKTLYRYHTSRGYRQEVISVLYLYK